jgi:hypothetical protein
MKLMRAKLPLIFAAVSRLSETRAILRRKPGCGMF